ncbi:alkaline phosphatase [Methanocaldococcus indicus]|uniref:alkaline phosphatase n=1 Tax=Methanocaldococcus indicus TaxID=213231 RepID=UPI003C6D73AA
MKKLVSLFLIVGILFSVSICGCITESSHIKETEKIEGSKLTLSKPKNDNKKVKNVILMIGDGMGITQTYLAERYKEEIENGHLVILTNFKTRGTITTYSLSSEVTDSAAAGTALLSGYKTNNGMINILPNGSIPRKTLGEIAKEKGKSVGIVTTTRVTHATPASVYAHIKDREEEDKIAEQLLEFEPDVVLGGGLEYFIPKDEKGSKRKDNKNLIEEFKKKGYTIVYNKEELEKVNPENTKKLLGLFSMSHMAYEIDRENIPEYQNQPSLAEMTKKALEILDKNPNGFFLMVEGGRIDHACHAHDAKSEIMDTIAFDEAVKVALDYQKKHPDTLIIVTADHETGGLSIGRGTGYYANITALKPIDASIGFMSKEILKNPNKEFVLNLIKTYWHINLTDKEKELLFKYPLTSKINDSNLLNNYPKINHYVHCWAGFALSEIESRRANIGWTSFAHTAVPVPVYAKGPGEEMFEGFYDNTDIPKKIEQIWT